jgi:LysR family glycine cleavage system transcriptional activator
MAAEELHVTPAALSYQIRQLEEDLNLQLFNRMNRAVSLTKFGEALYPHISKGFHHFRNGIKALDDMKREKPLTITAGPAFTAKWLAPRLYRFVEQYPDVEIRLSAALRIADFAVDDVDVAIRFGRAVEAGLYSEILLHESLCPMCTPEIARKLKSVPDLVHQTILYDESMMHIKNTVGWPEWLKLSGHEGLQLPKGLTFSNADHALDAALAGTGVVLARSSLTKSDIVSKQLVRPFPYILDTDLDFRFVCPEGREKEPRVQKFLEWLHRELETTQS